MPILLKLFQKTAEERTCPKSFYEATITTTPKPDKDNTKKENHRPISLMNTDVKIVNKILANRIQPTHRKAHTPRSSWVYSRMQGFFNIHKSINGIHNTNKLKDKNHMINLNRCKNSL